MSKIVPLISSGTAGPLRVLHLPRLWQKVSLEAAGKIADGYPGIGTGYDSMVIDGLGLDAEAVRSFITDSPCSLPCDPRLLILCFSLWNSYSKIL